MRNSVDEYCFGTSIFVNFKVLIAHSYFLESTRDLQMLLVVHMIATGKDGSCFTHERRLIMGT